jgi:hypothetical protein
MLNAYDRMRIVRTTLISTFVLVAALAVVTTQANAASGTKICGQIKNGPHASYWSLVSGIKQKDGTTWTVLATGVPCGKAIVGSKQLFGQWKKAKLGAPLTLAGFACVKMVDSSYDGKGKSSGGGLCHVGSTPATSVFSSNTFAFRMTGKYTMAQIKAFFHLS